MTITCSNVTLDIAFIGLDGSGCHHVVLASMGCDPKLKCSAKKLKSEIQALQKRGRPGAREGGERSDGDCDGK